MGISKVALNAHTVAMLTQIGETMTLARLSVTAVSSAGDETFGWVSVTTARGDLQPLGVGGSKQQIVLDVGGEQINVVRVGLLPSLTGAADGQRLYVGGAVTTTAEHWHVGRVDPFPGHLELLLTEKGAREP